ncbi:D-tyrosyl-tRNA(Tyr) deacylase [Candidatus Roizmanbacteria bacterium CG22_combo_CG10-13_8_21_14_all_38_20]|uniref:D-tyrosyl-tRNA(Tyr) deacylase n=1 Tax=Candidatus Roizmanbacteria bacterium CG22_combo_CG10-13_8_21_14_all_38_20 TaxID=1974862 RepID=A0A2H0BUC1_9BACT|nr:D-tyrosyl-tRNA(Tyr) deacylase [Candidatus Microgenomates bacterium]PIP61221.1 MAG: D-tyrosyl-tRNA(Tyr) deacylase [Candidatus Roizmanbacteria bacterium CG22_combo_CG10-13_8_21_14_all_38_20]PJC31211.1 MAG: D-tyrosyl-tRNA(Tyr) deacylase [Candidatus Roizmanbacteria bacterium CG_4_9_14_0_2_um_filter_38_17]
MRLVLQRVKRASVKVQNKATIKIDRGYLIYVAVGQEDTVNDVTILVDKLGKLRFFPQKDKVRVNHETHDFQKSIIDIKGSILVIPNYTLYGDLNDGNRPYFGQAAEQEMAAKLYKQLLKQLKKTCGTTVTVKTGMFGEFMEVSATNDGPATLVLEPDLIGQMERELEIEETDDNYAENFDDMLDKLGVDLDNI